MLLIPVQEASLIMIQIPVMFLFSHLNSTQSLPVQSLAILFQISFVSRYTSFFFCLCRLSHCYCTSSYLLLFYFSHFNNCCSPDFYFILLAILLQVTVPVTMGFTTPFYCLDTFYLCREVWTSLILFIEHPRFYKLLD